CNFNLITKTAKYVFNFYFLLINKMHFFTITEKKELNQSKDYLFSRILPFDEINTFEKFILDMFEDSLTGGSMGPTSHVSSSKGRGGMEALLIGPPDDDSNNFVEETRITIESVDPKNERIMIFVNGDRVRFEPTTISNDDNVLFGSRQLFQLIVPLQANDEIEKKKTSQKSGGHGRKRANVFVQKAGRQFGGV
ncbi:hypothetical protein RFI_35832, partial [Reticulomyxa filosa]